MERQECRAKLTTRRLRSSAETDTASRANKATLLKIIVVVDVVGIRFARGQDCELKLESPRSIQSNKALVSGWQYIIYVIIDLGLSRVPIPLRPTPSKQAMHEQLCSNMSTYQQIINENLIHARSNNKPSDVTCT